MRVVSKVIASSLLLAAAILPVQAAPLPSLTMGAIKNTSETIVTPGVTQKVYKVNSTIGPQSLYTLEVNSAEKNIEVVPGLSNETILGTETVSNQVKRLTNQGKTVVGAVNADYFVMSAKVGGVGEPVDLMVRNGEVLTTNTTASDQLAVFGIDAQGKPLIGAPDLTVMATDAKGNLAIVNAINKKRDVNGLVLYTPVYTSSTKTDNKGIEVVLHQLKGRLNGNNQVTAVVKAIQSKGNTKLVKGEYVLSGAGTSKAFLQGMKVGQAVTLDLQYNDEKWVTNEALRIV